MKKATGPTALKAYSVFALFLVAGANVSYANVYENLVNLGGNPGHTWGFFQHAILNTEHLVQFAVLGIVLLALWLARDLFIGKKEYALSSVSS